ncbi:uncharacterized protein LOC117644466 [Thrips palmi]|uniref:Uncharacterized protein LOC117644466 n=1 Tax=Thrips palmi TaxID=161013 RepID=A0A6P8YRA9_THRPL|nr:uncharacterized protein LOC117644466 [Thrips palmi]
MVSKVVVVALAALLCAQAFVSAAPQKEELGAHQLGGYIKCIKDLTNSFTIVKDITGIVSGYKTIFSAAKTAKAACSEDKDKSAEDISACKQKITQQEINDLMAETTKLGERIVADWPKVQGIISECF